MKKPNILLVVLDCVRADSFPSLIENSASSGFLAGLRNESVVFERAASVSPWSLPSHASIFTGLYPWDHHVHAKGFLELPPSIPTLAEALSNAGYSTACLSANGFLAQERGLVRGFQWVASADWWEHFIRLGPIHKSLNPVGPSSGSRDSEARLPFRATTRRILTELASLYPAGLDIGNRLGWGLKNGTGLPGVLGTSPWIEQAFRDWVQSQSTSVPLYACVNLVDAHDPYLTDPDVSTTLAKWWRAVKVHQQRSFYVLGKGVLTQDDRRQLYSLYLRTISKLERRLETLVDVLRAAGRWEDTLMIITSDHGQSFGEHDFLFHGIRVDNGLIRIPLWVRFPRNRFAGVVSKTWASQVDIAPTITVEAQITPLARQAGIPLQEVAGSPTRGPVVAIGDGVPDRPTVDRWLPKEIVERLDQVRVAAYFENRKIVVTDFDSPPQVYDVTRDPLEQKDLWGLEGETLTGMVQDSLAILARLRAVKPAPVSSGVRDRLATWGYT